MRFYGQEKIRREISMIIPEINSGQFFNILLSAPTGHGKTTLAWDIINQVGGFNVACLSGPPDFYINYENKKVVFIDEVHKHPLQENLYQYLDYGHTNYILATNELGVLKEPLINRCIPFVFEPYTMDDIINIAKDSLPLELNYPVYEAIAEKGKMNPRVTKLICKRLGYVFKYYGIPSTADQLDRITEDVLDLDKQGLNPVDRLYMRTLKNSGGKASLSLLSNTMHIDKATIMRDIEPQLIYLGLIKISSKGRELV